MLSWVLEGVKDFQSTCNLQLSLLLPLLQGLQVGDEILEFGSVNTQNFQSLHHISTVVQHSEMVSGAPGRRDAMTP